MSVDGAAPIRSKIKEIVPEYSFEASNAKQNGDESLPDGHFRAVGGHDQLVGSSPSPWPRDMFRLIHLT